MKTGLNSFCGACNKCSRHSRKMVRRQKDEILVDFGKEFVFGYFQEDRGGEDARKNSSWQKEIGNQLEGSKSTIGFSWSLYENKSKFRKYFRVPMPITESNEGVFLSRKMRKCSPRVEI